MHTLAHNLLRYFVTKVSIEFLKKSLNCKIDIHKHTHANAHKVSINTKRCVNTGRN